MAFIICDMPTRSQPDKHPLSIYNIDFTLCHIMMTKMRVCERERVGVSERKRARALVKPPFFYIPLPFCVCLLGGTAMMMMMGDIVIKSRL